MAPTPPILDDDDESLATFLRASTATADIDAANLHVEMVSDEWLASDHAHATSAVRALPPRASDSSRVSAHARYGMCLGGFVVAVLRSPPPLWLSLSLLLLLVDLLASEAKAETTCCR